MSLDGVDGEGRGCDLVNRAMRGGGQLIAYECSEQFKACPKLQFTNRSEWVRKGSAE